MEFKARGKAKAVFNWLNMIENTRPHETCKLWWTLRAWIVASDKDKVMGHIKIKADERLAMRIN